MADGLLYDVEILDGVVCTNSILFDDSRFGVNVRKVSWEQTSGSKEVCDTLWGMFEGMCPAVMCLWRPRSRHLGVGMF